MTLTSGAALLDITDLLRVRLLPEPISAEPDGRASVDRVLPD